MDGLERALRFFRAHARYLITTHDGPDADGLGAELLLAKALMHLGKQVVVANAEAVSARYAFLDPNGIIVRYDEAVHGAFSATAAVAVVDSADPHNLGLFFDAVLPRAKAVFAVDHHEATAAEGMDGYIDTAASSTCELILRVTEALGVPLDPVSAKAAYAGIVYDTGSFIYPKTTAGTFRAALRLVEAGAVPNETYRSMHENASMGALLLQKLVLSTLEIHAGGKVAFQSMSKAHLAEAIAAFEDAEPLINTPLRCREIEVSVFFKENPNGQLRCSLRSKGSVNVSAIAQKFGGGGHRTAAGFKCTEGLAQTKKEVLQQVSAALATGAHGGR